MPFHKHASFRYRVLDRCLSDRSRSWTLTDLIHEVSRQMADHFGDDSGVSKRSIQNDINIMRSRPPRGFSAPIVCKNGRYYYASDHYTIKGKPLVESDIEELRAAISILKQFSGLPNFRGMESIIRELEQYATAREPKVIRWQRQEEENGSNWLEVL